MRRTSRSRQNWLCLSMRIDLVAQWHRHTAIRCSENRQASLLTIASKICWIPKILYKTKLNNKPVRLLANRMPSARTKHESEVKLRWVLASRYIMNKLKKKKIKRNKKKQNKKNEHTPADNHTEYPTEARDLTMSLPSVWNAASHALSAAMNAGPCLLYTSPSPRD